MSNMPLNPTRDYELIEICKKLNIPTKRNDGSWRTLSFVKGDILKLNRTKYWRHDIKIPRECRKLGTLPQLR
jgi:hypothetical protein